MSASTAAAPVPAAAVSSATPAPWARTVWGRAPSAAAQTSAATSAATANATATATTTTASFADVLREQQEESDHAMALRMQLEEQGVHVDMAAQNHTARSQTQHAPTKAAETTPTATATTATTATEPSADNTDSTDGAAAAAATAATAATAAAAAAAADPGFVVTEEAEQMSADMALAMELQQQFDAEYREAIDDKEVRENRYVDSKVAVSMDHYRDVPTQLREKPREMTHEEEEEQVWEEDIDEATQYDRRTRVYRDDDGNIITKHNPTVTGRRNRQRVQDDFPLSFASGDLRKHRDHDVRFSNRVYNDMRTFAKRNERHRARLHEKKENSTAVMAMDKATRLLLYKMVNAGILHQLNGVVSTGKESIILHGTAPRDPDAQASETIEVAIKVFKTTLTEFKARQQFLHGDRRYEARVGRQVARKLVKMWAEKEMANLTRMARAGMRCPQVVIQRKHVLVMSFIGHDGRAAKKLKDADFKKRSKLQQCFDSVLAGMTTLYRQCHLVHCDLSEYNILWHDNQPWFIDVGQAVDTQHRRAKEYLHRDCTAVRRFFERSGLTNLPSVAEMLHSVSGLHVSAEEESGFAQGVACPSKRAEKKKPAALRTQEDTSDVCVLLDTMEEDEIMHLFEQESKRAADSDDTEEDEESEGEEVEEEEDKEVGEEEDEEEGEEESEGEEKEEVEAGEEEQEGENEEEQEGMNEEEGEEESEVEEKEEVEAGEEQQEGENEEEQEGTSVSSDGTVAALAEAMAELA